MVTESPSSFLEHLVGGATAAFSSWISSRWQTSESSRHIFLRPDFDQPHLGLPWAGLPRGWRCFPAVRGLDSASGP